MNKQNIKEQIAYKLENILENTDNIFNYSDKIPQIEMDILLENVRNLYDLYLNLGKLNKENFEQEISEKSSATHFDIQSQVIQTSPTNIISPEPEIIREEVIEPVIIPEIINNNTIYTETQPLVVQENQSTDLSISVNTDNEIHKIAVQLIEEIEEKTNITIPETKPEISQTEFIVEEPIASHEVVAELIRELDYSEVKENASSIEINTINAEENITLSDDEILEALIKEEEENVQIDETGNQIEPEINPELSGEARTEIIEEINSIHSNIISIPEVVIEETVAEKTTETSVISEEQKPTETSNETISAISEEKIKAEQTTETNLFSGSLFSLDEFSIQPKENTENKKKKPKSPLDLFTTSNPSIADSLQESKPTINDKLAAKKGDQSIVSRIQQQPITDLKKSIGINEKFLFINELFDGSMQDYNSAIDQINNGCKNISEARTFLGFLKTNYHWNETKVSVSLFENLVERRFILPEEPPF